MCQWEDDALRLTVSWRVLVSLSVTITPVSLLSRCVSHHWSFPLAGRRRTELQITLQHRAHSSAPHSVNCTRHCTLCTAAVGATVVRAARRQVVTRQVAGQSGGPGENSFNWDRRSEHSHRFTFRYAKLHIPNWASWFSVCIKLCL